MRDSNLAFRLEQSALALRAHFRSLGEIFSVHFARAMHIVLLSLWLCKYYMLFLNSRFAHFSPRPQRSDTPLLASRCFWRVSRVCCGAFRACVVKYLLDIIAVCHHFFLSFSTCHLPFFSCSVARDSAQFAVLSRLSVSVWCVEFS